MSAQQLTYMFLLLFLLLFHASPLAEQLARLLPIQKGR
jgi:hypothetical protein